MKTKEELNTLRNELEGLKRKLAELTEDELQMVTGGTGMFDVPDAGSEKQYEHNFYDGSVKHDFLP